MTGLARPIRTLIVDDEQMARASIRVLLGSDPEIELVGECASGVDAVSVGGAVLAVVDMGALSAGSFGYA